MNSEHKINLPPSTTPAETAGDGGKVRTAIKLKINRDGATASHPEVEISTDFSQQKTEMSLPLIQPQAEELSIADLINANVDSKSSPTDDDDLGWDDDDDNDNNNRRMETSSETNSRNLKNDATVSISHKMECIECGAIYESETPLESCTCPECHGSMYPLDLFNSEDTMSYLGRVDEDNTSTISMPMPLHEGNSMTESKRAIKVAQPVSVGMFSATGSGPVSGSTSSSSLKAVDFLSSTGSASAIQLDPKSVTMQPDELAAFERDKKNLAEDRRKLQQEQAEFLTAIEEFEKRSKAMEDMRINLELEKEQQTADKVTQTANLFLAQEQLLNKQHKKNFIIIIILSALVALETIGLIIMMAIRK